MIRIIVSSPFSPFNTTRVRELYEAGGPTKLPQDLRTEFERDYGRAIFSTPVRRLQDKAQVFPLERHDAVRTRLTHSIEVSSVARDLAAAAAEWMLRKKLLTKDTDGRDITTIAATCGLIHDIGNPPFGHSGEIAIADWFKEKLHSDPRFFDQLAPGAPSPQDSQFAQDFLKFEGNAQTQRLLSKLQILADRYGLNLTCGTLSASCKYTARSNEIEKTVHERSKPGFFASENELIDRVRRETGTLTARNPITYLVEASDDMCIRLLTWKMVSRKASSHGRLLRRNYPSIQAPSLTLWNARLRKPIRK
jgi:dGTPase